jgi:hypothetical protein
VNHPDHDSAGAETPAESVDGEPQPEQADADQVEDDDQAESRRAQRRDVVDALDVVPAVAAGAALGTRRRR